MDPEVQVVKDMTEKYKKLQLELETTNQTLYEYRRQMKTSQILEAEYQDEIKAIQIENQKLEDKVRHLEEDFANSKVTYNEKINDLEKELSCKENEIEDLQKELRDINKITGGSQDSGNNDTLVEEIFDLRENNSLLEDKVNELERIIKEHVQQKLTLEETNKQLREEIDHYKSTLELKREEIEEANILTQNLKDDYLCLKSELDSVRSKPLDDQSKGNSLFAEVDDRRLQLQENMKLMKSKYLEIKRERASLLKQVFTLQNENLELVYKFEAEVEGKKRDEEMILDSYKEQIKTLNDLIESYKRELKQKSEETVPNQAMKLYESMLAMKVEEIENLREKLSSKSLNYTTLSYDLAEANRQLRKNHLERVQLKYEISKLQSEIQELKLKSPVDKEAPSVATVDEIPKSILKSVEVIDLVDSNNENEDTMNRKVQFSENTVEPQITDRSKKRGAKVILTKPVKYF